MHIVSGFVSGINDRSDRDLSKYVLLGKELMSCLIPMTIFLEKELFDAHLSVALGAPDKQGEVLYVCQGGVLDGMQQKYSYFVFGHITVVFFEKTDLFLWPYQSMAHRFSLNTGNPGKDTFGYMMVQCQKTEWTAIACSFQEAAEFVWLDFGVFHMFRGKIDVFQLELYKMRSRKKKSEDGVISAARCLDPLRAFSAGDIYKDICWLFAGSVFGGKKHAILRFSTMTREKCFQILREKNTLMWEINVWALIYKEHPELFSLYPSDHSEIIVRGYS